MAVFDHLPNYRNVFLLATWFPVAIADTQSKILRCLKHQPLDYHKYIEILLTGMCTSLSLSLFIVPFHFHTQVCVHHQDQLSCTCSKYLVSTRRRRLIVSILIIIHDSKIFSQNTKSDWNLSINVGSFSGYSAATFTK